jgi:hypothetical protein
MQFTLHWPLTFSLRTFKKNYLFSKEYKVDPFHQQPLNFGATLTGSLNLAVYRATCSVIFKALKKCLHEIYTHMLEDLSAASK